MFCMLCLKFFLFKQKTAYEMRISDWSSDVCSSDLLMDVVQKHTREAGVRDLERQIATVIRKVTKKLVESPTTKSITITKDAIHKYLEIGRASCRERVCQYV